MSSFFQPPYEFQLPETVCLDPSHLRALADLYHRQPLVLDDLAETDEFGWLHGRFMIDTGRLVSRRALLTVLLAMRKSGDLGTKTDRGPRPRNDGTPNAARRRANGSHRKANDHA